MISIEANSSSSHFCPLCQAPLQRLKVSSTFHISNCSVSWEALDECPDGIECTNDSIFHYRDYSHSLLASYRCSNLYVKEKVEPPYENQKKTPLSIQSSKKSPKRPPKKTNKSKNSKRPTVKNCKSSSVLELSDEDDEDLDLFKPKKTGCNSLVSKRKLYKSNSDLLLDESTSDSKKLCIKKNYSKTNSLMKMSSSMETDNCFSYSNLDYSLNYEHSKPNHRESLKITEKDDVNLDACIKTDTSNELKSEKESSYDQDDESLQCSKLCVQSTSTKFECHETFPSSNRDESNSSFEIDLKLNGLKFDTKPSDHSSSKNIVESATNMLEKIPLTEDLEAKKVEKHKKSDKTTHKTVQQKFDFFAPTKHASNDKRSKPKSDLTFSNVKTIIPGVSDDSIIGLATAEKNNPKATGKMGRRFGSKPNVPKVCPFYKRIPDTNFVVDAFQYGSIPGVQAYFLTHFHSDHYIGLKKGFSNLIFCSQITANLVKLKIGVNEKYINVINLNERTVVNGVEVVPLDANHCPGSLMLLFQLRTGQNYLHVGDFRANIEMESYPELKQLRIHKLFLDTTYCKPAYTFPTQKSVIEEVLKIVRAEFIINPRTLIVVGSYLIGKEKVFMAIAEEFNCRIWAEPSKMKIFDCIENKELKKRLTSETTLAKVHVVSMMHIGIHKLKEYLRPLLKVFSRVVAFRPTGWCHNNTLGGSFKRLEYENVLIYEVPYSEHSSYAELQRFVQFTKPENIIPTVNVNETSLKEMNKHFKIWLNETSQPSILDYVKTSNSR